MEDRADLDLLWSKRDEAAALEKLEGQLQAALESKPGDFDLLRRASRLRHWMADGAPSDELKAKLAKEGWDLSERAVEVNPRHAAGHYYAALNVAAYAQAIGFGRAAGQGLERKFNDHIDAALALDDAYDDGGPHVAKGRSYYELPWPKRDLERSKTVLQSALQRFPHNLRARLFLAETLLREGDAKRAKEIVDGLAEEKTSRDPPEDRRIRLRSKPVAEAIDRALK